MKHLFNNNLKPKLSNLTKSTVILTSLLLMQIAFAAPLDDFVITIKSDNGPSLPTEFTIPTYSFGTVYNYNVDCNSDGINEATGVTGDYTCDYASLGGAGTYTIRIKDSSGGSGGTGFPSIYFNNVGSKLKIVSVDQWGTGTWTNLTNAFLGAVNMDVIATDTPDLSMITFLYRMFLNTPSLVGASANWNWDVSNVAYMDQMFQNASAFDQDISSWDVTNVVSFTDFLTGAELSPANYDALLTAWDILNLTDNLTFDAGNSQLCNAVIAYSDIIINDGWTFNDGGLATNCPLSTASIITVGPVGSTCDITTGSTKIQDAIDFGPNTIRLVNTETYNENIIIDDIDIAIIGGYANCDDAVNGIRNPNDKSIINGSTNTQATIRVFGSSQFNMVDFTGLEITGGTSNALGGGGILASAASVQIVLRNSFIHNNSGRFGGGVGILASSTRTNLFAFDTTISANEADDGGGLYCNHIGNGLKPIIEFDENSFISNNSAINGGGTFLTNGCNFKTYAGILTSSASQNGGGIYADNGAIVILYGHEECDLFGCTSNNIAPVILNENKSLFDGGGAYISGVGTELSIFAGSVKDNQAGENKDGTIFAAGNGGGIYINDGATLNVKRLTKECWDQRSCNLFDGNYPGLAGSVGRGEGGALYNNNSTANIEHTQFVNHLGYSPLLYATGSNSVTNINSSIIANNGGAISYLDSTFTFTKFLSRLVNGAIFNIYHSTIADNEVTFSLFRMDNSLGNTARMATSIVSPHGLSSDKPIFGLFSASASIDCTIVYEDTSVTSSFFSTVADPLFIAGSNYRIDPVNSPAVDYCFANHSNLPDIDFEPRGIDLNNINNFGPYDIGADEAQRPDAMFSDGFEN